LLRSISKQSGGIHVVSPEEEKESYGGKDLQKRKGFFIFYLFITPLRQHSKYKHTQHINININIMHDKDLQKNYNYLLNETVLSLE